MDFAFSPEQEELRRTVRQFLDKTSPETEVRRLMATERGYDPDTWHRMADELGLEKLAPQRGWEALRAIGWTIQKPRPRNPKAATAAEQDDFKKKSPKSSPKKPRPIPASRSKRSRPTSIDSD